MAFIHFVAQNDMAARKTTLAPNDQVLYLIMSGMRRTLLRVSLQKSTEQSWSSAQGMFRPELLKDISISLSTTIIIPLLKMSSVSCLNDYRSIALT